MSNLVKGVILLVAILAVGAGLVVWKSRVGGGHASASSFNSISKSEIEMLLADVAKSNPAILKRLNEDPKMKKDQLENLKQLLAFASQAKADGLADTPTAKQELENIKSEIIAVNYDREMNKDKGPLPAFGFITEEQVKAFWDEGTHEEEFNSFLNTKLELMNQSNPEMNREISEEEKKQARDVFAKIRLYKAEYEKKAAAGELDKTFIDRVNLQVKLQQAQFLARLYSEKVGDQMKATDEEVAKYIADHPEIDPVQKKAKAQQVLDRAKAGEDFATLANEFSEDPGNKVPEPQGGLYKDVPKGRMVGPFEAAALGLQQGQVAPEVVETDFGYHIIKLERALGKKAGDAKEETYDVRHILISTAVKDPTNPMGRDTPVKDHARAKVEEEKEKKLLEEIIAKNHVTVPEDFDVPQPTQEQLQQMQQRQQQMMMPPPEAGPGEGPQPGQPQSGQPQTAPKPAEPKKK